MVVSSLSSFPPHFSRPYWVTVVLSLTNHRTSDVVLHLLSSSLRVVPLLFSHGRLSYRLCRWRSSPYRRRSRASRRSPPSISLLVKFRHRRLLLPRVAAEEADARPCDASVSAHLSSLLHYRCVVVAIVFSPDARPRRPTPASNRLPPGWGQSWNRKITGLSSDVSAYEIPT